MGVKSLALGLVAGYVLGARAGRQRYEQIAKVSSKVWNSKPVQAGVGRARDAAGAGYSSAKAKLMPKDDDEIEAAAVEF